MASLQQILSTLSNRWGKLTPQAEGLLANELIRSLPQYTVAQSPEELRAALKQLSSNPDDVEITAITESLFPETAKIKKPIKFDSPPEHVINKKKLQDLVVQLPLQAMENFPINELLQSGNPSLLVTTLGIYCNSENEEDFVIKFTALIQGGAELADNPLMLIKSARSIFQKIHNLCQDQNKYNLALKISTIFLLFGFNKDGKFERLPMLIDSDLPETAPYLDLLCGTLPLASIDDFISTRHKRTFIMHDRAPHISQTYRLCEEFLDLEPGTKFSYSQEDVRSFGKNLEAASIGTIRARNLFGYVSGETNISKIFAEMDRVLMPKGKIVISYRDLDKAGINSVDTLKLQEPYFKFLLDLAEQHHYELSIGHTDDNGNFVENKFGRTVKTKLTERCITTDFVFRKPES